MQRIREERQKIGLKQKEIAEIIGMDRTTYAKYETGDIMPPVDVLKNLAKIFGVSVDYLIELSDIRKHKTEQTCEQSELIDLYESMNEKGKETAMNTIRALAEYPEMMQKTEGKKDA